MPGQQQKASSKGIEDNAPLRDSASKLPLQSLSFQFRNSQVNNLTAQIMKIPDRARLIRQCIQIYERGAHVFYNGDQSLALYVIMSGSIKTYLTTADGKEQALGFHLPRDVFGYDGAENQPHQSSAVTLEKTSVCRLAFAIFSDYDLSHGYPRLISDQLAHDYHLFVMLTKKNANGRVASFLCDLSRRFEMNGYSPSEFNLSMSRHDLGNYLGLAVETVSRTLTRFKVDGMIDVNRRAIKINKLEQLRRIAGEIA